MAKNSQLSKMFGALVLGGGMLVPSAEADAQPMEQTRGEAPATEAQPAAAPPAAPSAPAAPPAEAAPTEPSYCQIELTLHKYKRDGVDTVKSCLDGKTNAEILKAVEDAKKQTCGSPFCGCWLG